MLDEGADGEEIKMGYDGGPMDKKREVEPWRALSAHIIWCGKMRCHRWGSERESVMTERGEERDMEAVLVRK